MAKENLIKKPVFTEDSYRPLPSIVTINKSSLDGLGLYATTVIEKDQTVGITHIYKDSVGWIRTPLGGFINHSDNPNCVLIESYQELILYTQKKIDSRDELTVYYSLNEYYLD